MQFEAGEPDDVKRELKDNFRSSQHQDELLRAKQLQTQVDMLSNELSETRERLARLESERSEKEPK
jgi:hypothetical protein